MANKDTSLLEHRTVDSNIYSISLSHDGTRVASGSQDGQIRVWDLLSRTLVLGPLKGHTAWVKSVAWSHDDTRIISGSHDHTIRIWDAHTGTPIGEPLKGHAGRVYSVALSPDSALIVSGSRDGTVRIWDTPTGALIGQPLRGHSGQVDTVAFSPNGAYVVSGSTDDTVRIWDALTRAPVGEPLRGHTASVLSVNFSPDSTRIVSGSWDKTICIWDVRTSVPMGDPLGGHTGPVNSVAYSPDSTRIASGSSDTTVRVWDAHSGDLIGEPLAGHATEVRSVCFSRDSARIISGSLDSTVRVWEAPHSTPYFDMVTSNMSAQEMFERLVRHGCADLSSSIDPARYSSTAIASGGFGDVWQAWMKNGTLVAMKCLRLHIILEGDLKGMKRTTRELHNWSKARHENIQELLGVVMFQGRLGMISLWMHNGNLQHYIEKNPHVERYPLCIQVAKGVAYLHSIGMVHGDIKAINILVSADGIAKISDFDYSILSESTLRFSETSKTGGGTVRWMAPELLLHQEDDDAPPVTRNTKTDVYALGMTMLEIVSGKVPYYQYQFDVGIIRALDKKLPPKRPQTLSEPTDRATRMWSLLLECWDHDPLARPDAASVLESLQGFVT